MENPIVHDDVLSVCLWLCYCVRPSEFVDSTRQNSKHFVCLRIVLCANRWIVLHFIQLHFTVGHTISMSPIDWLAVLSSLLWRDMWFSLSLFLKNNVKTRIPHVMKHHYWICRVIASFSSINIPMFPVQCVLLYFFYLFSFNIVTDKI